MNADRASQAAGGALPLVSIVIPTYEQAELAREAVASALAQDYPRLEVLLVDDASPHARYDDLACSDPRLRIVRNDTNLGRVGNYRRALYEIAQGDWVVNLDGDDYLTDRGFIGAVVDAASQDPAIVIVAARCVTASPAARSLSPSPGTLVMDGIDVVRALPRREYLFMHLATAYKRQPALALDFYRSPTISADWESLYRLAVLGKVAFIDREVGVWRIHGSNASGAGNGLTLADNLAIWPAIFDAARAAGLAPQAARSACRRCLSYFGRLHLPAVLRSASIADLGRYLNRLWRLDPLACATALRSPAAWLRMLAGLLGYYRMRAF